MQGKDRNFRPTVEAEAESMRHAYAPTGIFLQTANLVETDRIFLR
jgi:hypothetical protein